MLETLKNLRKSDELVGLNRRNAIYQRPYNTSRAKKIADDKLLTKKILSRHAIPTAEIYKVIRTRKQLNRMHWEDLPKSFALKPNIGTGGSGIIVFYGRRKNTLEWIRPDGSAWGVSQLKNHINNILEGQFSMGNRKDIALIEERIINDPLLRQYSYKGVPDIRIIVFNKVPIMGMLRLPTLESEGKANLHAGCIGVGVDIATGITTTAAHRLGASLLDDTYEEVEEMLDEPHLPLSGVQIPRWKEILRIAIKCQEASGLGYFGVDIALDRNKGPVVFELNARPGLAIQTVNRAGFRKRLERIKGLKIKSVDHSIRLSQNIFGGEVEDEVKAISGRQIVGLIEKITITPAPKIETETKQFKKKKKRRKGFEPHKTKARIDTGKIRSKITSRIAIRTGYKPALDHFKSLNPPEEFENSDAAKKWLKENKDELEKHPHIITGIVTWETRAPKVRPVIGVELEVAGQKIKSNMMISERRDLPHPVILGRRDMKTFLIDASKTFLLH